MSAISSSMPKFKTVAPLGALRHMCEIELSLYSHLTDLMHFGIMVCIGIPNPTGY